MESLLLWITLASLGMTGALGVLLLKLLRDERRRSDARVAALRETALSPGLESAALIDSPRAAGAMGRRAQHPRHDRTGSHSDASELRLRPESAVRGVAHLFGGAEPTPAWRLRALIGAAMASLVVVVVAIAAWPNGPRKGSGSAEPPALELLSLEHSQRGGTLTVTGIVQNPRHAGTRSQVVAVVSIYAADGNLLASGRAPLDYTSLGPGDDSPFVITVALPGPAARYRVSFRGPDGRIIAHVDRRDGPAAVARNR